MTLTDLPISSFCPNCGLRSPFHETVSDDGIAYTCANRCGYAFGRVFATGERIETDALPA